MATPRREPVTSRRVSGAEMQPRVFNPLYIGMINWKSVRQQEIENCPLPAVVAAIARIKPQAIQKILDPDYFAQRRDWYSWFDGENPRRRFEGQHLLRVRFKYGYHVRSSPMLWRWKTNGRPVFARCTDGSEWISMIEKAYVMFRAQHTYEQMDASASSDPPSVERIVTDFWGLFHSVYWENRPDSGSPRPMIYKSNHAERGAFVEEYRSKVLRGYLKSVDRYPAIATTWSRPNSLIGNHTYVVTGYTERKRRVRGRWRWRRSVQVWEAMRASTASVAFEDFFEEFDAFHRARSFPW